MLQLIIIVLAILLLIFGLRGLITGKGMSVSRGSKLEGAAAKKMGAVVTALGVAALLAGVFIHQLIALVM